MRNVEALSNILIGFFYVDMLPCIFFDKNRREKSSCKLFFFFFLIIIKNKVSY
jgi:hypothetical protein